LKSHLRKVSKVRRQASAALSTFTKVEKRLTKANDAIVSHLGEIDQAIDSLNAAKTAMTLHHQSNTHVIGQIAKITRVGGGA
jgi:SpoU rRNA methylase family enzyme